MKLTENPNSVRNISVVGLGKLGAPLAACLAHRGYHITGVDLDDTKVQAINEGIATVFEPGLKELLQSTRERLSATKDLEGAIHNSQVTFILVPTPSEVQGGFSLRHVVPVCERIGDALRKKSDRHLVVLTSTVLPGSTANEVMPILEKRSGKRCGREFGLCYSPEFVALGNVIRDLLSPDFILIGESDPRSGDLLASVYKGLCENDPPVARMNFVNAEVTKLSVNTFVTTKITFANMLARICERLPGANVDVVTSALGLDSRIGAKYLKGAIGYGGPCFPRDNLALAALARGVNATATLAEATDSVNRQEVRRLAKLVQSKLPVNGVVGILGLSYKPNTDVVEESQGLLLAQILLAEGISVAVYDPAGMKNARKVLDGSVVFAESTEACAQVADVIVIATAWEEFKRLPPAILTRNNARRVLVDCWRVLDARTYGPIVEYFPLGVGTNVEIG
ncbi:MAG TPA: nucleotide sugar dehydrogenase [Candidatus Binatia bacterium]